MAHGWEQSEFLPFRNTLLQYSLSGRVLRKIYWGKLRSKQTAVSTTITKAEKENTKETDSKVTELYAEIHPELVKVIQQNLDTTMF